MRDRTLAGKNGYSCYVMAFTAMQWFLLESGTAWVL
jgi:hypothetical protein